MADPKDEILEDKDTPLATQDENSGVSDNSQEEDLTPTEDNEVPAPAELLDMSDDDFVKIVDPVPAAAAKKEEKQEEVVDPNATPAKKTTAKKKEAEDKTTPAAAGSAEVALSPEDKLKVYDTLFSSFKANGRDMQVETPEEALRLMQMGAGHLKYQAKVRPALAIEQTLKNNKIDQAKLNFLIDCANGKPEAIKKLVRDAKIEPYDIDTTEESRQADADYRPTNHVVSDNDLLLSETIATVQGTAIGDAVLKTVRADWDDNSRTKLVEDPGILNVLVEQKTAGIYDRVVSEVERRRALGKLATNVSWLDAYYSVGLDMEKSGAFSSGNGSTSSPGSGTAATPATSKVIETATAKKKAPAGGDPSGVAPVIKTPVVPLKVDASVMDMSDAEFEKLESKFG